MSSAMNTHGLQVTWFFYCRCDGGPLDEKRDYKQLGSLYLK